MAYHIAAGCRIVIEPVVEALAAGADAEYTSALVDFLAVVRQLALLVKVVERISDQFAVAAKVLDVGFGQMLAEDVRHAADAQLQHRSVLDLRCDEIRDGYFFRAWRR